MSAEEPKKTIKVLKAAKKQIVPILKKQHVNLTKAGRGTCCATPLCINLTLTMDVVKMLKTYLKT